jgi:sodium-coupled neutral amino acid transporter 11
LFYYGVGHKISDKANTAVTRLLLAVITALALALDNVGFVISFNGALMGSAIIYIFPSLLFLKSLKNRINKGVTDGATKLKFHFNRLLIIVGGFFAIIGGAISIVEAFFSQLLK